MLGGGGAIVTSGWRAFRRGAVNMRRISFAELSALFAGFRESRAGDGEEGGGDAPVPGFAEPDLAVIQVGLVPHPPVADHGPPRQTRSPSQAIKSPAATYPGQRQDYDLRLDY